MGSEYHEIINKKVESLTADDCQNPENKETNNSTENMNLKDRIESQIKQKYNLIIPAILIEIHENGKNLIEFEKEDLKNVIKLIILASYQSGRNKTHRN
jgi:hypothetical protein